MKTKYRYIITSLLVGLVSFAFIACNDDDMDDPRLFKPTDLSLTTNYDGFVAKWKPTFGAEGYELEASLSNEFESIDTVMVTDGNTLTVSFKGLKENKHYYVRLRGTRNDSTLNSKYIYGEVTTGTAYSIFYPVNTDSISFSAAILTWRDAVEADRIHIEKTSGGTAQDFYYSLTQEDIKNKRANIPNLNDGAGYKATMLKGNETFGYTLFTVHTKPEGLISITAAEKDNLQSILDNAAEGATILFTETGLFDYSNQDIIISKSVTLMGEPGVAKPKLYAKNLLIGGRTAAASINVGEVKIERIEFSGYKLGGNTELISSEPNACLISCYFTETKEVNLTKLIINDCIVRNYANSLVELNDKLKASGSKARFDEINVNKALVYDIGRNKSNYPSLISISNKNDKNGFCKKYVIKNSTFYNLLRGILEARVFTTIDGYSDPDVLIENCTFDKMGKADFANGLWYGTNTEATKNVFDFKASGVTVDIKVTINNCVWGEMSIDKLSNKFFQQATAIINNTYMLDASKKAINDGTLFMTTVSESADVLFPKRSFGNYTMGVEGPVKDAGDPRWNN